MMISKFFNHWLNSFRGLSKEIWLLSLVNFINRLGSMVVLFMTLYLTEKKGYSLEVTGYILVANGIGSVIGTYLGGWLTDKTGYYKLQIVALHLQGFILFLLPHIDGAWYIALTVLTMSVVSETIRPANSVAFIAHSSTEMRTRSMSLNRMGVNLSFTAAPAIGGFLVNWSWEAIFWVDGITCILAAWILIFFITERKAEKTIDPVQKELSLSAYRDKRYLQFIGLSLINATVFMQLIWSIPYFFSNAYHWDKSFIGLVLAANGLVVALVEMPLIFRIEHKYPILGMVRTGLICYGLSYLSLAIGLSPLVAACIFIGLISLGEIFVMPFSFTYVSHIGEPSRRGQYMALYSLAYAASQIVAPFYGTQVIAKFGFDALWFSLVVLAAFSFIGTRMLEKRIAEPTTQLSDV
jgi:predicted MFS family arabinose efflux permease